MGTVFNIQKFSINDGPGIRTTVFLKGCPLNCIWCHNPESKQKSPSIFFDERKCIGCRACEAACPVAAHSFENGIHRFDRSLCRLCGMCAEVCSPSALEVSGREMTSDEVISEVMRDKVFYDNSGGGITLSGGEPMYQFDFTYELLSKAKENGLHTCIETSGFAGEDKFRKIAPLVDIFLYDYKETDSKRHKDFTGAGNELILHNLRVLDELGAKIILRCPIIPTCNNRDEHFLGIARLADSLNNIIEINIEPYHPLGKGKSEQLGCDYALSDITFPDNEAVAGWIKRIAENTGVPVKKA